MGILDRFGYTRLGLGAKVRAILSQAVLATSVICYTLRNWDQKRTGFYGSCHVVFERNMMSETLARLPPLYPFLQRQTITNDLCRGYVHAWWWKKDTSEDVKYHKEGSCGGLYQPALVLAIYMCECLCVPHMYRTLRGPVSIPAQDREGFYFCLPRRGQILVWVPRLTSLGSTHESDPLCFAGGKRCYLNAEHFIGKNWEMLWT